MLLDVDGCLVDSSAPILRSLNTALSAFGLSRMEPSELARWVGPPLAETSPEILAAHGGEPGQAGEFIREYRDDYAESSIELAASYPGVPAAVSDLAGIATLAVVTSKPIHFARPILEALGLARFFAVMEGPGLSESEPKKATLARALERLGVGSGRHHVMVGDRRHDIEAGRANGVSTVGVTWGFGTADELADAGADAVVDDPDRLVPTVIRIRDAR